MAQSWVSYLRTETRDLHDIFNLVYSSSRWTDQGNKSGPGSDPEVCQPMWRGLAEFIKAENIRSIVDVSCGGMAWWPRILEMLDEGVSFYGFDASEVAIGENKARFYDCLNWKFQAADARTFRYPPADLFVCRQTINHLWREDALGLVRNVSAQARRFVAFTTDNSIAVNPEDSIRRPLMPPRREATCYTRMNLNSAPFDLTPSIHRVPDVDGEALEFFLSEYPRQSSCCMLSAFIGESLDRVRQSPAPKAQSFFWTNKEEFRPVIEKAGWTFIRDTGFSRDPADSVQTSIRSKYFKFLQFLREGSLTPLDGFRYALWADAKRIPVSRAAYDAFLSACPASPRALPGITIRTTPPLKETLEAEIEAAMPQKRYAQTMDHVRQVIAQEINAKRAREVVRICNTGLILYDLANPQVRELNKLIYNSTIETQNPECQIFFALYRQRFSEDLVHVVPYDDYPSVID
jgi:Methyltransferase domain